MKGILFTTDAIFSLLIVAFAITILSYFVFTPDSNLNISFSKVDSILSLFTSTNIKTLSAQSSFNNNLLRTVEQSQWTQIGENSSRSYTNPSGPNYPFILYSYYVPNGITTNLVSSFGTIYFGSKNQIFAINSSTGKTSWINTPFITSNTVLQPNSLNIYSGQLIYTNGTQVHAVSLNNDSYIWNYSLTNNYVITSSPLIFNNQIYFGASDGSTYQIYSINTFNGSFSKNVITQFPILYLGQLNGSIIATDLNGNMLSMNFNSTLMSKIAQSGPTIPFTTQGSYITLENGTQFCKSSASFVEECTPHGLTTNFAISKSEYNNLRLLPNELFDIEKPGTLNWVYNTNLNTGNTVGNPIISNNTVYTIWNDGFILANNLSNGDLIFKTQTPSNTLKSMILSDGILSVASANHIYSFGSCFSNTNASLVYALTYLYSKGFGSCATYLSYSEYPSDNYGVQINGVYGPSNTLLQYSGNSFTEFNDTINVYTLYLGSGGSGLSLGSGFTPNTWYSIGVVNNVSLGTISLYINGKEINSQSSTISNDYSLSEWIYPQNTVSLQYINGMFASFGADNSLLVGCASVPCINGFNGIITNLQLYSGTLTYSNLSNIYQEGIANYPVSNMGLYAWLPLEGDTNDYSGLGHTGYNSNVTYTYLQYTPPLISSSQSISQVSILSPVKNTQSIIGAPISSSQGGKLYKFGVFTWQ
ncbi:MAG: hypothetical protein QXD23_00280 [Candidatus Micrarchaeaceae archaeon]